MEAIDRSSRCITCQRALRHQRQVHVLHRDNLQDGFGEYVLQRINPQEIADNNQQLMCHRCWMAAERAGQRREEVEVFEEENDQNAAFVGEELHISDYFRAANTARRCIVSHCQRPLRRIPETMKRFMLLHHNFYIPPNARICQHHLERQSWFESLETQPRQHLFTATFITDMLNTMKDAAIAPQVDFDDVENIDNDVLYFWTGLNHEQFNRLVRETPALLNESRRPKQVLGVYLSKLRTGEPNQRLASFFKMDRRTLERKLEIARRCLMQDFAPRHLGYDHISREEIIQRNLSIPQGIYAHDNPDRAIVIMDGTYVYIQKSGNFLFQKQSYSLHKFRNLMKPFLVVCCDGYIIDVSGPHTAITSDATIISNIANNEESPLHMLLQENDVVILDRGFRDAIPVLQQCGYDVYQPATLRRGQNQLTTEEANRSRLVTIVRWVVEVINGRFKRDFKIFRQEYFNRALPHMMVDFKIAAALLNNFREPVQNNPRSEEILNIIRQRRYVTNKLADYIEQANLNRQRAAFVRMTADAINHFPRMTLDDLYLLSLGSYQIKLARSYCKEHMREDGLYTIEVFQQACPDDLSRFNIVFEEDSYILRARIQSRHVTRRIYYSYIIVNREAIEEYYCSCLTGRRTVGTCAHIISIVWYLGYARHEPIFGPADFLDAIIIDEDV